MNRTFLRVDWNAAIGATIIAIVAFVVVLAPLLTASSPNEIVGDVWAPPSSTAWLGLDNLGRDVLARIAYGGRVSIGLSLLILALSFTLGVGLAFTAVVSPRWVDTLLSRLVDGLMAMPSLMMALVVLSVMGTSIPVLIFTIAVLDSARVFRLARAVAMNIVDLDYVKAARLRGEGWWWLIRYEIFPNSTAPLIAELGIRFSYTLLFISSLSFLGLGLQPPTPDWGSMVKENAGALNYGGTAPLIPALAIALVTIGVNLLIDWYLRRADDPKRTSEA